MPRGAIGSANFVFNGVDLEVELNTVTVNFDVPSADITAFTDVYQNVVAGKPSAKLDMAGSWNPTAAEGDATIFAALGGVGRTWDLDLDGTNGYNGYAIVNSYSITASVTDAVKYTCSMQHNGTAAAIDGAAPTRG